MAPLVTAFNMPALYVVAMPAGGTLPVAPDNPHTWFLDWNGQVGPRVAGDLEQATVNAARALSDRHAPNWVGVYQLTDNTAGVMGPLLEVVRLSRVVTPG